MDMAFYVLSGSGGVEIGDKKQEITAGAFKKVPNILFTTGIKKARSCSLSWLKMYHTQHRKQCLSDTENSQQNKTIRETNNRCS